MINLNYILEIRINSCFEYKMMNFSCDEYILKLLLRKYSLLKKIFT